jgi:hypothetical protein
MRVACFLVAAAPLGCNLILGNEEVHLAPPATLDGSPNDAKLDVRSPDTSVGPSGGSGGSGGTSSDDGSTDGRVGNGGSAMDGGPGSPDSPFSEGGDGTADGDSGPNPTPDGSPPIPDSSTPPDVSDDPTTPPTDTDSGIDSTPPPPGDGGPTCTSPQIECAGQCVSPTDPKTCGSCTHDCTNLPHVSGPTTCQAGTCIVPATSCASGYAHCSTNADDGCEVDITKPEHCGSCTTVCAPATPLCAQNSADGGASWFQCKSQCAAPTPDMCGMSCTDETTDELNCGTCGVSCPSPTTHGQPFCNAGRCAYECNTNYSTCGNDCVDLKNDPANCMRCGNVCPLPTAHGKAVCSNAACSFGCDSGYPDTCNGTCVNLKTDVANCGTCGVPCTAPLNGTVTGCSNGVCQIACNDGYDRVGMDCTLLRFYIAETGDDTAAGTEAAPFKTWKRTATRASLVTNPKIFFKVGVYVSDAAGEDFTTKIPEGATVTTLGGKVLLQGNGVAGLPFAGNGTVIGGTTVDGLTLQGFSEPFSTSAGTQTLSYVTLKEIQKVVFVSSDSMTFDHFAMDSIEGSGQFNIWSGTLTLTNGTLLSFVPLCLVGGPTASTVGGTLIATNVDVTGQLSIEGNATLTNVTIAATCGSQNRALYATAASLTMTNCQITSPVEITKGTNTMRGTTIDSLLIVTNPGTYDFGTAASKGNNSIRISVRGDAVTVNAAGNHWIPDDGPADATGNITPQTLTGPYSNGSNVSIDSSSSSVVF